MFTLEERDSEGNEEDWKTMMMEIPVVMMK